MSEAKSEVPFKPKPRPRAARAATTFMDKVKKHPVLAYVLSLLPIFGIAFGVSNWYLTRSSQQYQVVVQTHVATALAKDAEIERLQSQLIELSILASQNPRPQSSISEALKSSDAFFKELRSQAPGAEGRQELVKKSVGKQVTWYGNISALRTVTMPKNYLFSRKPSQTLVFVSLKPSGDSEDGLITATFSISYQTKLAGLSTGQRIKVSGVIREIEEQTVKLDAFALLEPKL